MARAQGTIDPDDIANASQIPPQHAQHVGLSPHVLVDVFCGTLPGDVDALPAAKELLGAAADTGGLSNVDYIYSQVATLYGSSQLPAFSSSGKDVKSLVFVSGSDRGSYGAFHIGNAETQNNFDRIVTDSLNVSGNYSAGSGLGHTALAPLTIKVPRLFAPSRGPSDLLGIIHDDDPRLQSAKREQIRVAHAIALQSILALRTSLEARNTSLWPRGNPSHVIRRSESDPLTGQLIHANRETLGLVRGLTRLGSGRQYLSTALFAAEIIESFQTLTHKSDPGKTDGEAMSRVISFKLAPEIALIPGFSAGVTQQWWQTGHPDFVNDNSQDDQSIDGNAAGVMFLLFLTDYLGIPMEQIIQHTPPIDGAPLGRTYENLVKDYPALPGAAGRDGKSAFQKMISLLEKNTQSPDGMLNLPANGNAFPAIPGAKQGGLFGTNVVSSDSLIQDAQAAIALEVQVEQQLASLKSALGKVQAEVPAVSTLRFGAAGAGPEAKREEVFFAYGPPLPASVVAALQQQVASYRAPEYDQQLQQKFWPHVYNELPGSGTKTGRLQVITGTIQTPEAVQITGTIADTRLEPDGDLHISFRPDDPGFPFNHSPQEPPLEIEIIYAGPVTQDDAKKAKQGYTNPFDTSQLHQGTRIQAAGPLIYDRAHGRVDAGGNVQYGLEIHPLAGMTILAGQEPPPPPPVPPEPVGTLSGDLASALGQARTLGQTVENLAALIQKMQGAFRPH